MKWRRKSSYQLTEVAPKTILRFTTNDISMRTDKMETVANFFSSFLFSAFSIQMKKHTEKLDRDEEVETFEKIKKKSWVSKTFNFSSFYFQFRFLTFLCWCWAVHREREFFSCWYNFKLFLLNKSSFVCSVGLLSFCCWFFSLRLEPKKNAIFPPSLPQKQQHRLSISVITRTQRRGKLWNWKLLLCSVLS